MKALVAKRDVEITDLEKKISGLEYINATKSSPSADLETKNWALTGRAEELQRQLTQALEKVERKAQADASSARPRPRPPKPSPPPPRPKLPPHPVQTQGPPPAAGFLPPARSEKKKRKVESSRKKKKKKKEEEEEE